MTSSVPTAVVVSAVSPGSFQIDCQVHHSSLPHQYENSAKERGNEPAGIAMQVHHSDFNYAGMWADEEEPQRTEALVDAGIVVSEVSVRKPLISYSPASCIPTRLLTPSQHTRSVFCV
jgi:hypothetical protein